MCTIAFTEKQKCIDILFSRIFSRFILRARMWLVFQCSRIADCCTIHCTCIVCYFSPLFLSRCFFHFPLSWPEFSLFDYARVTMVLCRFPVFGIRIAILSSRSSFFLRTDRDRGWHDTRSITNVKSISHCRRIGEARHGAARPLLLNRFSVDRAERTNE